MSKQKKRERGENWTREERDILLEIIKNYRHILDNQSNNTNTNKLKNIVWNHINNRFNEISNSSRDVAQLKSFWKRLKVAARKKARSQTNGSVTSDEKLSHCEDSSPDEATNNISSYDNDDSLFGQTCNPSEVVLLVESNHDSHAKSDSHNINESLEEEEEIHSSSFKNGLTTLKFEDSIDCDMPSPNIRLQYRGLMEKPKTEGLKNKNHSTTNDRSKDNYLHKEFLLKRFYLRQYYKNQIKHEHEKHKLEIENLLLERKKIELEIELSKKKLELLDK